MMENHEAFMLVFQHFMRVLPHFIASSWNATREVRHDHVENAFRKYVTSNTINIQLSISSLSDHFHVFDISIHCDIY